MPGAQSCKCSCEVTFSQPKHSFVIMVATPFWNSGTSGTPDLVYSPTSIFPDHPSVAPHLYSLIVVHPSPPLTQPSGGRTTQNSTRLFRPTCLGAQTCAPPSGATALLILSLGTGAHSPSTLAS